MRIQVEFRDGVMAVQVGEKVISLDPKRASNSDFTFVSHAHTDHLSLHRTRRNSLRRILASHATTVIANSRGHDMENPVDTPEDYSLIDTGHILGSRGFLVPDEFFYSGDISIRERAFLKGRRPPKVKRLILESTFARPEYVFPPLEKSMRETNELISQMYDWGVPLILMGYPLGKAQLLTEFFRHWDPLIVNESVFRMNSIYRQLGVPLKGGITLSQARERGLIQSGIPWIMISPFMSKSSEFIRAIKSSSNAVTIGFSGWASRTGFKQMMGLDYAMPISDHCDFNELLEIVRCCDPEKIYTIHGSSDGFASRLRAMGYEAEAIMVRKTRDGKGIRRVRRLPLSKDQTLIDSYLG